MHGKGIRAAAAAVMLGGAVLAWGGIAGADKEYGQSGTEPAVAGISVALSRYYQTTENAEQILERYLNSRGSVGAMLERIGFDYLYMARNGRPSGPAGPSNGTEPQVPSTEPPEEPSTEAPTEPPTEPPTEAPTEPPETSPYANVAVSQILAESSVNVRTAPSTVDGEIVGKIRNHCAATILETVEGEGGLWYRIESGNVTGYIKAEYFLTGDDAEALAVEIGKIFARVRVGGLRLREEPTLEGDNVITNLWEGEVYTVKHTVGSHDDFVQISLGHDDDGNEILGYVYRDYVDVYVKFDTALTLEEIQAIEDERRAAEERAERERQEAEQARREAEEAERRAQEAADEEARRRAEEERRQAEQSAADRTRSALVSTAMQYLGMNYVWGGESLSTGVDCSGFTMRIYEMYGYSLPHYSGSQANCGTQIDPASARPGDLIFYARGGVVYHVAIYIGDGQIIHAASESLGVCVSGLNYADVYCAVSLLP